MDIKIVRNYFVSLIIVVNKLMKAELSATDFFILAQIAISTRNKTADDSCWMLLVMSKTS